jgi:hypothetical protein
MPAAAIIALGGACASSVVVTRQDADFAHARERLTRVARVIDDEKPTEEERSMFLQAEGFYRYRFAFPPRSILGYVAQGAAAVTDLPALQSLAGSVDLLDLRLRSYDGAVHLWESLLEQYPSTVLRPQTLYRLGWAYRTAGASGLPHESGDEVFDLLIKENASSRLADLATVAKEVPWKSKSTATALSIVPGLGQIYVGEYANGALRIAVAAAAITMIAVPAYVAYHRREDLQWRTDWPLLALGLGGLVVLSIDYTAAYQDALRAVVEFNEREEDAFETVHPDAL